MKRRDLLAHIELHGCVCVREGSRHTWYSDMSATRFSAIPRHREVVDWLAKKICRELAITPP